MRNHLRSYLRILAALAVVCLLGTITHVLSQGSSQALTGFSTPTLNTNPGSQSVSNGFPEPAGDSFAQDQEAFEEQDGVDKLTRILRDPKAVSASTGAAKVG